MNIKDLVRSLGSLFVRTPLLKHHVSNLHLRRNAAFPSLAKECVQHDLCQTYDDKEKEDEETRGF